MRRHREGFRAGIFLNLSLAVILLAIFFFGNTISLFSNNSLYGFLLPSAEGLIPGTKVVIAGIQAGRVKSLALENKSKNVRVNFEVSRDYQDAIRTDSRVSLMSQGVLGDKVIMISIGSPDYPEIPEGGLLKVRRTASFNELLEKGDTLLTHLDHLVVGLDQLTSSWGRDGASRRISKNVEETTSNLANLTRKLKDGFKIDKANDAIAKLDSILEKIDNGSGTLGALVNDPGIYDDAKALVGQANRNRIVRNLVRKSVTDSEEEKVKSETGSG